MSLKSLYAAATGMEAQETRINSIANNLANVNTQGFKSDHVTFEDLMYDQIKTPGLKNAENTVSPIGIQVGHGTRLVGVYKNFSQGEFTQTNRELDVGIQGNGFFQVTRDNGETAYTRDGAFRVDAEGNLVTSRGEVIEPAITVPTTATSISISESGVVSALEEGSSTPTDLGTLELVTFPNSAGLKALGQNLFYETEASGAPTTATPGSDGAGVLLQGFLESSNVNVAEELINMIVAQRSYEANSKVLQTTNDMMRASANIL